MALAGSAAGLEGPEEIEPESYDIEIVACTFDENRAEAGSDALLNPGTHGGALHVDALGFTMRMTNSVFRANSVYGLSCQATVTASGGAISFGVGGGWLTIVNSTFVDNVAETSGAVPGTAIGVALVRCPATRIRNTILWGNTANGVLSHVSRPPQSAACWDDGTVTYAHCNVELTSGTQSGTGNINADPLFVDREAGDLRLTEESPCIDTGGIVHLVFDHFDINRNEDQGEYAPDRDLGVRRMRCADMGAYEFILTGDPPTGDLNGDWAVDFNDLLVVLAAWGPCEGCPEDLSGNDEVDFADVLIVLANWGDCPGAQVTQGSVAECIDRLGYTNPAALAACIEAMIINGTP